ncbi:hypothetical protein ACSV9I_21005 [Rhizobium sp. G187]|uniref:hypothetical protein n=1 Tax=Rhizobium sp. G187 TaxID=3451352 RepID=UPI003EE6FBF7
MTYVKSDASIIFLGEEGYDALASEGESSGDPDDTSDESSSDDGSSSGGSHGDDADTDGFTIDGVTYRAGDTLPDGSTFLETIEIRSTSSNGASHFNGTLNMMYAHEYSIGRGSSGQSKLDESGTTSDEVIIVDENGDYVEADFFNAWDVLFSPGIDITNGVVLINPNSDIIPRFAIPDRPGIDEYSTTSIFYHDYESSASVPLDEYQALRYSNDGLSALEDALISNPTPGDDGAATINGTINDAGNLGPVFDGDDNLVYSFIVENPDANQSDIVVNYTIAGEHVLANGYVARMVQRYDNTPDDLTDADYGYSLLTFGEGDAFLQGAVEWPADIMADAAWYQNALEIFGTANESLL